MNDSLFAFEVADWRKRIVRLTKRTFEAHCVYRPETRKYLQQAQEVIRDPDHVLTNDKGATLLYRFGVGESPFSNLYLEVIVYYNSRKTPETGIVATYFFTHEMDPDASLVEHRYVLVAGTRFPCKE